MILGLLAGVLLAGATAQAPVEAAPTKPKATKVAVLDVQSSGTLEHKAVEGLSSLLASEVARRPSLTVLAGSDLRSLMGFERQKQLVGCTEAGCLAELAGGLGVSYLVASEVSKVGSSLLLSLTLLDARKAVSLKRLTRRAYSDDSLVDETPGAVDELLEAMPGLPPAPPRTGSLALSTAASRPGVAVAPESLPGYHQHDGFYMRLLLGGGGSASSGGGLDVSGPSGAFAVALGGSVNDHLVIYAEVFDEVDTSPTVKVNGTRTLPGAKLTHTVIAYGVGAAWYFMPADAYVSATAAVGNTSIEVDTTKYSTKNGFIGRVSLGKEWWVSQNWGLGLGLNLTAGSMAAGDGAGAGKVTSRAASLAFSATFN